MRACFSSNSMKHLLHFIPYPSPQLILRQNGQIEEHPLLGEQFFSFSPIRACIGYKSDSSWHPCSNRALNVRQCPTCQFSDVARVYTIGDFTLYPHLYDQLLSEKYIIYLAQFGSDITKLGLTRLSRLEERWCEQGADLAAPILEFEGPDEAYKAEALLQEKYSIVGAVRASQKLRRLHFDKEKARLRLQSIIDRLHDDQSLSSNLLNAKIVDLSSHYPQVFNPEEVDFVGGKILGAKGAWLFFEGPSGLHYAVNMHSKEGRFLVSSNPLFGIQ